MGLLKLTMAEVIHVILHSNFKISVTLMRSVIPFTLAVFLIVSDYLSERFLQSLLDTQDKPILPVISFSTIVPVFQAVQHLPLNFGSLGLKQSQLLFPEPGKLCLTSVP